MKKLFSKKPNIKLLVSIFAVVPVLAALGIFSFQSQQPKTPDLPDPPLKTLAKKHDISLGNFAILTRIGEKPYADILTQEFDFVLADNTPNWYFTDGGMRPGPNEYNFKQVDEVVTFAQKHNMEVEAHHYLWGEEKWLPKWLKEGNYTKPQLMDIIKDHIMTVGGRYQGKVAQWTVVNEAFTRQQNLYGLNDWWTDAIGDMSYIDQAFIWARQADPNSKLILNDFHNESINDVSNAMYEYVKGAKARGIPIDGIGMQMHIDGTHPPTKDEVVSNMKRFADLGVGVYVTEFDVNMNDLQAAPEDKDKIAGNIYYEMMRACIEVEACKHFAYLGITDKETWYNYMGLNDPRPLMFDEMYRPKQAYFSTRAALEQQ